MRIGCVKAAKLVPFTPAELKETPNLDDCRLASITINRRNLTANGSYAASIDENADPNNR